MVLDTGGKHSPYKKMPKFKLFRFTNTLKVEEYSSEITSF